MTDASRWTFEPASVAGLLLIGVLYSVGAARLRRAAGPRAFRAWQPLSFAAAWVVLVVALVSPMAVVSESLLSVHMTQHELLMVVAAPLMVIARPLGIAVWALPPRTRRRIGAWARRPRVATTWRLVTGGLAVWILHGAALWIWHAPPLYEAAVRDERIHALMHVCFLFSAALFWWALVHGRYGRLGYGMGILYAFTTGLHTTALGALMTIAPSPWYAVYRLRTPGFGVDPLADQQLAGLLMWVPFCAVFMIIALAMFAAWLGEAERRVRLTRAASLNVPHGS